MDLILVAALLSAALLHAAWHAMIKSSGDKLVGLAGMNVVSTFVSLFALPWVPVPRSEVWPVLAVSVVLHCVYKSSLARVYLHGDLGQAYPIARGLAPIFAALIAYLLLHEQPGKSQIAGIALISCGLLAMSFDGKGQALGPRLIAYAALTGLMVAMYSVVDAHGTRLSGDWLSYTVWLMAIDGATFVGLMSTLRGRGLWQTLAQQWQRTVISGLLGVAAFSVFLWALSLGSVGAVSALRESSVLFASLIGVFVLKERWSLFRLGGAVLISSGIGIFAVHS